MKASDNLHGPAFLFREVVKEFAGREGAAFPALDSLSFEALTGKITCLVGPTGSGKSTVLRVASGLEAPDAGLARVAGQAPEELTGRIGYLTQRHTLFPWMKIGDNIALPLEIRKVSPDLRKKRTGQIIELLGLKGAESLYPHEVSGGMQQRAAIGRLIASEAAYWLMDEPFSALDEKTLHRLQRLFLDIVRQNGLSVLFVTHSIDEAVFLADRVVILSAGPGRVVEAFDIEMAHPRDRLSQ